MTLAWRTLVHYVRRPRCHQQATTQSSWGRGVGQCGGGTQLWGHRRSTSPPGKPRIRGLVGRAWPQTEAGGQQRTLEARRCLGLTFEADFFFGGGGGHRKGQISHEPSQRFNVLCLPTPPAPLGPWWLHHSFRPPDVLPHPGEQPRRGRGPRSSHPSPPPRSEASFVFLHHLLDPLGVSTDLGVDAGSLGLAALLHAPRDDALEAPVANQRSPGVPLAKDGVGVGGGVCEATTLLHEVTLG